MLGQSLFSYFAGVALMKWSYTLGSSKSSAACYMHLLQDGPPVRTGIALTDLSTGLYAHGAILAALLHRQQTNSGQWIQCNLLSSQVQSAHYAWLSNYSRFVWCVL